MTNPVVRWQIVTPDAGQTATFYERLFGWEVSRDNALGYREVGTGVGGLPGGIWPAPPAERPFVQLFVAVPDVEACVRDAELLGGRTIVPATALPDGDVMAIVQDPSGLTVGVCTLRDREREAAG